MSKRLYVCGSCDGAGVLDDYIFGEPRVCQECMGAGELLVHTKVAERLFMVEVPPIGRRKRDDDDGQPR